MSRGSFHSRYAVADKARYQAIKAPRLIDYITSIEGLGEMGAVSELRPAEFAVVDLVKREKAYIEFPFGSGAHDHKAMIESLFMAPATLIAPRVWIV